MLAMDVHQLLAQFAQLSRGGGTAVDPGAALALAVDASAQQQRLQRIETRPFEPVRQAGGRIEFSADLGARCTFTNEACVGAGAQHKLQRVNQYGLARASFTCQHAEAGVEIQLYQPRFLHAKHLTVDDDIAVIGSTNIDIRSFALNAEINLVLYDRDVVRRLREIEDRRLADSDRLTLEAWRKRPVTVRVLQNIARLADSLL